MENKSDLFNEIKSFLATPDYLEFAKDALSNTGFHLVPDLYDVEIDYTIPRMEAANVSLGEIKRLTESKNENFKFFCHSYLKIQHMLDLGEEYNPEEFDEADLEESNEHYVGHSQTFVIQYAVLYILLSSRPDELTAYLKKIREPHAAKQSKLLRSFYISLDLKVN